MHGLVFMGSTYCWSLLVILIWISSQGCNFLLVFWPQKGILRELSVLAIWIAVCCDPQITLIVQSFALRFNWEIIYSVLMVWAIRKSLRMDVIGRLLSKNHRLLSSLSFNLKCWFTSLPNHCSNSWSYYSYHLDHIKIFTCLDFFLSYTVLFHL